MRRILVVLVCLLLPAIGLAEDVVEESAALPQSEPAEQAGEATAAQPLNAPSASQPAFEAQIAMQKPVSSSAQLIWVGGGFLVADETRPQLSADLHADLGDYSGLRFYTQPLVSIQGQDPSVSLGLGARLPLMDEQAVAGANLFFDWTGENHHRRLGLGGEFLHSKFSLSLNAYLPFSDRNGREEAIPGFDVSIGVPIPGYEFLTVRPGAYYYNGRDADDVKGLSLALEARPVEILDFALGARSDSLDNGRNEVQVFAQVKLTWPMRQLGRDIFSFKQGGFRQVPVSCYSERVRRENAIAVERKTKPWDML